MSSPINVKNNSLKPHPKLHFQRFEFKYQIPLDVVEGIIPELLKYMEFDPFAKNLPGQSYTVASLYYDSAGLDCYYQKLAGLKTRKKLRLRLYDFDIKADSRIFLEIKRKYDMVVVKDRLALNYNDCYNLLELNKKPDLYLSEAEKATLDEFLWLKLYNGMLPQNMVIYDRKPFVSKVDPNFRVTIDYNLKTYLAKWLEKSNTFKIVNPGQAILEVKFNNVMPFWFQNIIQRYSLERQPFSKYCESLEICYPNLSTSV